MLRKLWSDDAGFLVSMEALFLAVILVLGLVAGWSALRGSLLQEYGELAEAVAGLNDSYFIASTVHPLGGSGGTLVTDTSPTGLPLYIVGTGAVTTQTVTTQNLNQFIP